MLWNASWGQKDPTLSLTQVFCSTIVRLMQFPVLLFSLFAPFKIYHYIVITLGSYHFLPINRQTSVCGGGPEIFEVVKAGDQFFFQCSKGGPQFFTYAKGGPEKNGDWPSQTDGPPPRKK